MSKRSYVILSVMVMLSTTLSFLTLTRGHPWWDDFAGYLLQAKSILAWSMKDEVIHNTFTIQNSSYPPGPAAYPWGFPLLLAPVLALVGLNPLAFKLINLCFFAVFLFALAFLAGKRLPETDTLLLVAFFAFAPSFMAANDLILSDIPFLAVSTLALVMIEQLRGKKDGWGVATGAVVSLAFFLRTNGILLLAPLLWVLLLEYGLQWRLLLRKAKPCLSGFVVFTLIQIFIFPTGQSSYFSHFSMFSLSRLAQNFIYYLQLPAVFFDPIPGAAVLYVTLLIFAVIGARNSLKRDSFLFIYALITIALFIFWPERQGLRFIYPVLPVLFISAFNGIRQVSGRFMPPGKPIAWYSVEVFFALLVTGLFCSSAYLAYKNISAGRDINGPFDTYSYQMYEFVNEQTPPGSVILFVKPRALRLFTGHDAFMSDRCNDMDKADYIVLSQKMQDNGQISPDDILSCDSANVLAEVYRNKRFVAYKINH